MAINPVPGTWPARVMVPRRSVNYRFPFSNNVFLLQSFGVQTSTWRKSGVLRFPVQSPTPMSNLLICLLRRTDLPVRTCPELRSTGKRSGGPANRPAGRLGDRAVLLHQRLKQEGPDAVRGHVNLRVACNDTVTHVDGHAYRACLVIVYGIRKGRCHRADGVENKRLRTC